MIPLIREPPSREHIYLLGIAFALRVYIFLFFVNRASGNILLYAKKRKKKLVCVPGHKPVFMLLCFCFCVSIYDYEAKVQAIKNINLKRLNIEWCN